MALDFPSSPTPGQVVTIGGVTWTWDGVKWTAAGTGANIYLPLTGGIMTGPLTLNADATAPLQAATFEQVNARGAGDNRIINGDMRIDQRNNGAIGTAASYTVDRWVYGASQDTKGQWQRGVNSPQPSAGFPYSLVFTSTSAYALLATDQFIFYQPIEADQISDFQFGTSNAQTITLSFWAYSSLTGTFGGALQNYAQNRSYPFSYSVPAANTWTKIAITIPGDTGGTWVTHGNVGAAFLMFDLGAGATCRGPANAWASSNYVGVTGAKSVVATNGAQFLLTGVKLEIGSIATPFNRQSLAKSMIDCQRYFSTSYSGVGAVGALTTANVGAIFIVGLTNQSNTATFPIMMPVSMRSSPSVNIYAPSSGAIGKVHDNSNNADVNASVLNIGPNTFGISATMAAAAPTVNFLAHYTASAEL